MLSFIFTEDSFRADIPEGHETQREQKYREAFARDRYRALFQLGFEAEDRSESPASLLGNWEKEAEHFTPSLPVRILDTEDVNTLFGVL